MPVSPLKQREIAFAREASFGAGIPDWDAVLANGGKIYVTSVEPNLREEKIANENLRRRASDKPEGIFALKKAEPSFETYAYGVPAGSLAADQGQAARIVLDECLLNALQGEVLGYRAAVTGGVAGAPTLESGAADAQPANSWGFFYDPSSAVGHFRKIASVNVPGGDNTYTMASGHDLPIVPAGGQVCYAAVHHFPHWDLLEDHTAAQVTGAMFVRGKHPAHVHEVQGVRLGLELGEIAAGTPTKFLWSGMGVDFTDPERYDPAHADPLALPTFGGTPEGMPAHVPGRGTSTRVWIANVGATLAGQQFWGSISAQLGIVPDSEDGPNARNGIHGFSVTTDSYDGGGVELMVPRERFWKEDFRAGVEKHLLIQIGDQPGNTRFIYFGRLSFRSEPEDGDHKGRDAYMLKFDALEPDVDVSAMTPTQAHRARAKFELGRVG